MVRVGIDIGGTSAKLGLVSPAGAVLRRLQVPTGRDLEAPSLVESLSRAARELAGGAPLEAVGVAAPGCRRADGEGVINVTNLPYLDSFPLRAALAAALGAPTAVDNDANAAALGEARYGAGVGAVRVLTVTVGTGIGAGMVVEGRIHRVAWEGLGDAGHVIVQPGGVRCLCGGTGCVEALASVPAMLRRAAAAGSTAATFAELVAAAAAGEPAGLETIRGAGFYLGVALATLAHVLAPTLILVGGGGADAAEDFLMAPLRAAFAGHVQPFFGQQLSIRRAALGNDAGLVGAAALAAEAA